MIGAALSIAASLFVASGSASANNAPITIRYIAGSPATSHTSVPIVWWGQEVEKRTNGRVKIQFFWSGSLVRGPDSLNAIGNGLVEMGKIFTVDYKGQLPLWNIGNLAFTSADPYVSQSVLRDLRKEFPEFNKETDRVGVVALGGLSTGGVDLLSRMPIRHVKDLKGLKVRAQGIQSDALKAVGAIPVSVPFGEVYEAFQHGLMDAATMYELSVLPYRFVEVATNYTYAPLGQAAQGEVINRNFWNRLPADIREILQKTMDEAHLKYVSDYNAKLALEHKKMEAGDGVPKVTFIRFPQEEIEAWRKQAPDFFAEWVNANARVRNAKKIAIRYRELEAQYEKQIREKGHPHFAAN